MAFASKVTIKINDIETPGFIHLTINQTINQPHSFELVCRRDKFEQPDDSPLSSAIDKIGSIITFSFEGIQSGTEKKDFFFKGIINKIDISDSNSNQEITFSGHSPDILLHGYPTCRSFENMTLKQIADKVVEPYPQDHISLKGDPANDGQFPYVVQYKETNYEFLRRLAARIGEWFFYDGQKLVFGNYTRTSTEGYLGIDISHFSIGARIVPLKFKVERYQYHSFEPLEDKSSNYDIANCLNSIGKRVQDKSLDSYPEESVNPYPYSYIKDDGSSIVQKYGLRLLDREKQMMGAKMVAVSGKCNLPLVPGTVLQIKSKNSQQKETQIGDYLVTTVSHTLANSMIYQNSFQGIPAETKITPNSDITANATCETQSALVTENHDPQKLGRVKVRFFWQTDGQSTPWIRSVNLMGGKEFGSYFIPEINSEVLVGFMDDDPQQPYILGPMSNGTWKPDGGWVNQSNEVKSIRSRTGHTIEFNDKKDNEKLVIYNSKYQNDKFPGSDKAVNTITLDLHSQEIIISSSGNIKLSAGGNIEMEAKGDIKLKSENIKSEANDQIFENAAKQVKILAGSSGPLTGGELKITESGDVFLYADPGGKLSLMVGADAKRLEASIEGIDITGPKIGVKADALAEITGGIVKIN